MAVARKIKVMIYLPVFGALIPLMILGVNGDWQLGLISGLIGSLVIGMPSACSLSMCFVRKEEGVSGRGWLLLSLAWPALFLIPGLLSLSAELHGPVFGWVVLPASFSVLFVAVIQRVLSANDVSDK